jgi:hypothetical protein
VAKASISTPLAPSTSPARPDSSERHGSPVHQEFA